MGRPTQKSINSDVMKCPITLYDSNLTEVEHCRDLGVFIDSKLKFSMHVTNVVSKAKQRSALLLRSFITKDASLLMQRF